MARLLHSAKRGSSPRALTLGLAASLGAVLLWVTPALAQHGPIDASPTSTDENVRKAQSIARQTMSPFCPGRTLSDCPSEYATQWRHDIQSMVDAGKSASEIQAELERRAGGDLSGSPNRTAGYGVPLGLAAGALLILFGVFRYLRGKKQEEAALVEQASAAEAARPSEVERTALEARLEHELDEELAEEEDEEDT